MKLGTIITAFFLCAGTFASCTHESIMDQEKDEVANLSVVFAVGEMKTKTDYTHPDSNETLVNEFFVALYDTNNNFIDSKVVKDAKSSETVTDQDSKNTPAYSVNFENIRIGKTGKNVYAVVVANSGLTTLKAGSDIPANTSVTTTTFTPAALVKAGKSETVTLSTPSTATNNKPTRITVPMTQLSARIDFMGVTVENSTFTPTNLTLSGGNAKTLVSIYYNNDVENTEYMNLDNVSKSWSKEGAASFYTYEYKPGLSLSLTITGKFSGTSQSKTLNLDVTQLLATKDLILTKGHLYKITGKYVPAIHPTIVWSVEDWESGESNVTFH